MSCPSYTITLPDTILVDEFLIRYTTTHQIALGLKGTRGTSFVSCLLKQPRIKELLPDILLERPILYDQLLQDDPDEAAKQNSIYALCRQFDIDRLEAHFFGLTSAKDCIQHTSVLICMMPGDLRERLLIHLDHHPWLLARLRSIIAYITGKLSEEDEMKFVESMIFCSPITVLFLPFRLQCNRFITCSSVFTREFVHRLFDDQELYSLMLFAFQKTFIQLIIDHGTANDQASLPYIRMQAEIGQKKVVHFTISRSDVKKPRAKRPRAAALIEEGRSLVVTSETGKSNDEHQLEVIIKRCDTAVRILKKTLSIDHGLDFSDGTAAKQTEEHNDTDNILLNKCVITSSENASFSLVVLFGVNVTDKVSIFVATAPTFAIRHYLYQHDRVTFSANTLINLDAEITIRAICAITT